MSTLEKISGFVTEELLFGEDTDELASDENLLASGLVDSIGMMRLINFIEAEFEIRVPPADVTIESFRTLGSITQYIEERIAS